MKLKSWRSPKVERRDGGIHGLGLFALEPIKKGELIAVKAGKLVDHNFVKKNLDIMKGSHMQISEDLFLAPTTQEEWNDTLIGFNHSCDPNAYVCGQVEIITKKEVAVGEEIFCDFSLVMDTPTHIIEKCLCGSKVCRGRINPPDDWKDLEFQKKNKGYFSSYIQRKIDSIKN